MKRKLIVVWIVVLCGAGNAVFGADGTWTNIAGGNWSTAGNWNGGAIADGADSTAYITANINVNRTVANDVPRTIGNLEFSDGGISGFTWFLGGGSALTLSASGTPQIRWGTPVELYATLAGATDVGFAGASTPFGGTQNVSVRGTNTYTGVTTLRRGNMTVWGNNPSGANSALGNASSAIQVGDGGTLVTDNLQFLMDGDKADFARPLVVNNAGNSVAIGNLANSGYTMVWSGDITLNRSVLLASHATAMRMTGKITGPGGFVKTDSALSGFVVLQGSNDFSGDVTISRGTLIVAHSNALGTATTAVQLGDVNTTSAEVWLRVTNGITVSRDVRVSANGTGLAGIGSGYAGVSGGYSGAITLERTLTGDAIGGSRISLVGPISGTGGFVMGGNSDGHILVLNPTNSYTGDSTLLHCIVTVSNVLQKGQNSPLGNSTNAITLGGQAAANSPSFYLDFNGVMDRDIRVPWAASSVKIATRFATNLVVSGNLALVSNAMTTISADNAVNRIEWSGSFSGTGTVQKSGAGTLVLSGDNSAFAGGINLAAGTLRLNSAAPIGNGRFQFTAYNTRLENTYGPYVFTNGVEFLRPAYYYGADDIVFLGEKKINANLDKIPIHVDQTNALLAFRGNLVRLDRDCGIEKNGAGLAEWGGTNLTAAFTNLVTINAGVLRAIEGPGISILSPIRLFGGIWESTGLCTRALGSGSGQLYWSGSSGGFSAYGAPFRIDLYGSASNLHLWGAGSFVSAALEFGSVRSDNPVTFADRIDLNGASRTLRVYDNTNSLADRAVLAGGLQGSTVHGITKLGPGALALGGTNTYLGNTAVNEGTLLVDGELDYAATAVVQCKSNAWLGGRGTIRRPVTLDAGFAGFDWADAPGTLTIATNLALPKAFAYNFRRTAGQVPLVTVTGTLTASNAVTVNVFGEKQPTLVLFTAGALAGTQNLTNWVVTGSAKPYTVKVAGTSIIASYPPSGAIIMIR
jgi:autotransporter-associated beta strand protein